jgi:hypothetical protein
MSVSAAPPMAPPPTSAPAGDGPPEGTGSDPAVDKLIELIVTVVNTVLPDMLREYIKANRDEVLAMLDEGGESPAEEMAESAEGLTATDSFADLDPEDVEEED